MSQPFTFPFPQPASVPQQQPAPAVPQGYPPAGYAPPMMQAQPAPVAPTAPPAPSYAIPPGYVPPPQPQAVGSNPILNALANAKPSESGTQFPRINALYLIEVDAIKVTGTQGIRYGCIEAKVVQSQSQDPNGQALPAGGTVSILENLTLEQKGGPGRFLKALQTLAGEDWTKLQPSQKAARMAHFILDQQNPVQGFQNLGLGLRLVIQTSPGESTGKTNGGVKTPIVRKNYQPVPKTVEDMQRIDALRAAAGFAPLAQAWNVGL